MGSFLVVEMSDPATNVEETPVATQETPTPAPTPVAEPAPEVPTPVVSTPVVSAVAPTAGVTTHPQRIAALYVGDLNSEVTESDLFEFFKKVGSIQSIKVCRDSITRRSLGYGYVNFTRTEDADRAISLLNYSPLKGKPIRICWSQRDPSLRRSNVGNLFIKNFPKDLDALALEEIFQVYGNIISGKVQTDNDGKSLGYGFVQFSKEEDSKKAIEDMNGSQMGDKALFVGPFIPKNKRGAGNSASLFTNVFVKELPASMTEKELCALFSECGTITSPYLCTDSPRETTYGFVNFDSHDNAVKAVETMNQKEVEGRKLYVGRAQSKGERIAMLKEKRQKLIEKTKNCNLYVRNLPSNITEQQFTSLFAKYGTITSSKLMMTADGQPKGFGFVCYSTPEEATAARESNLKLDGKPLFIVIAQPKAERRIFLENQHARGAFRPTPRMVYQRGYSAHPSTWAPSVGQYAPYSPHPNFMQGHLGAPKPFNQYTSPMNIVEQLSWAITQIHDPKNASRIANLIYDSTKETNESIRVLIQDPTRLKQKIDEAVAILERNGN